MSAAIALWIAVTVSVLSLVLNLLVIAEKVYAWTPHAKHAKESVRLDGKVLRVPWHRVRFDRTHDRFMIPGWGWTPLSREGYELAKEENLGWEMIDASAGQDMERHWMPIKSHPL